MKYCTHCGNEVHDEAVVCIKCGCAIQKSMAAAVSPGIAKMIKVFMILGSIGQPLMCGVNVLGMDMGYIPVLVALLLPLAWCIPMTVSVFRSLNHGRPIGMGMKICVLLFVNTIAGVLLLCQNDQNQ